MRVSWKRKSYAIEEHMSGDWIERWSGFTSLKKARSFAQKMDGQCHGRLRVVRVTRVPLEIQPRLPERLARAG